MLIILFFKLFFWNVLLITHGLFLLLISVDQKLIAIVFLGVSIQCHHPFGIHNDCPVLRFSLIGGLVNS